MIYIWLIVGSFIGSVLITIIFSSYLIQKKKKRMGWNDCFKSEMKRSDSFRQEDTSNFLIIPESRNPKYGIFRK